MYMHKSVCVYMFILAHDQVVITLAFRPGVRISTWMIFQEGHFLMLSTRGGNHAVRLESVQKPYHGLTQVL